MGKQPITISYNGKAFTLNAYVVLCVCAAITFLTIFCVYFSFGFIGISSDVEQLKQQLMVERTINSTLSREINESNAGIKKIVQSVTGEGTSAQSSVINGNITSKVRLYGILKSVQKNLDTIDAHITRKASKLQSIINVARIGNYTQVRHGMELIHFASSTPSIKTPFNIQKVGATYQISMVSLVSQTVDRIINKQSGLKILQDFVSAMPLEHPLANGHFVSGFGVRSHPIYHREKMHYGVDFAGRIGSKVLATGEGIIERAVYSASYGNYIIIRHKNNIRTLYAHMSAMKVKAGQKVRTGQEIGIQGSTGNSTGSHVHYEMTVNGTHVDPLNFIRAKSLL